MDFPDADSAAASVPIDPVEPAHITEAEGGYTDSTPGLITPAVFATGSKDNTIALWNLFADSYK